MPIPLRLLLIEDNEFDAVLISKELARNGYDVTWERVDTAQALAAALERPWDLITCDWIMPRFGAPAALEILRQHGVDSPIIVLSGEVGEEMAVTAMKAGAHDFVGKNNLARLVPALQRELQEVEIRRARKREEALRDEEIRRLAFQHQSVENALRDTEELYRLTTESSRDLVTIINLRNEIRFMSPSVFALMGRNVEQEMNTAAFANVHPDDVEELIGLWGKAFTGETVSYCHRARHEDGTWRWLEGWGRLVEFRGEKCALAVSRDVTERKLAEEALRLSEDRYRDLIENAHDLIYVHDLQGNFLSVNRAAEIVSGYSRDELLTMNITQIVAPEHIDRGREIRRSQIAGDAPFESEIVIVTKDGRRVALEVSPRLTERDGVKALQGIARDITDRKRAEEQSQTHLRMLQGMEKIDRVIRLADDPDDMMADVLDMVLSLFQCDRAWLLHPCDPDAASWRVPMERCRPEYPGAFDRGHEIPMLPEARAAFRAALDCDGPVVFDQHSGREMPAQTALEFSIRSQVFLAVHPRRGKPWLFGLHQCSYERAWTPEELTLLTETGRRIADGLSSLMFLRELRSSEQRYRDLFENAPDVIYLHDLSGNFLNINRAGEKVTGYTREELLSLNLVRLVAPEDFPRMRDLLRAQISGQAPVVAELAIIAKDGRRVTLEVTPRLTHVGEDHVWEGIAHDITDRKAAEDQIRALNESLERRVAERTKNLAAINHELESFSASVSHDLRGPLRIINGFSRALEDEFARVLEERGLQYLHRIRSSATRMGQLIDDLLGLSRVTTGKLQWESVDLSAIARAVAIELQKPHPERRIDWRIASGLVGCGDAGLLRVALENLLGNAWKYTSKHSNARIEFGVMPGAECLERTSVDSAVEPDDRVYYIRDDGAGFDMKLADELFKAFRRLHSEGEFEGSGIGLATVQRIVHCHGGRIWAEAAPEQGASFYFTLGKPDTEIES